MTDKPQDSLPPPRQGASDADADTVLVGRVAGVVGLEGLVRIESHTDPRDAILDYRPWRLTGAAAGDGLTIERPQGRKQGRSVVARLPGVSDREGAAPFIDADIYVPRAALPPPGSQSWYWRDLEGLSVVTVDGIELGEVAQLVATGANDVLVVRNGRERLIPFVVGSVVREVDLDGRRIVVDWDPDF